MGSASSSIVINLSSPSSPSSEPAADNASLPPSLSSSSSEPVINNASSSTSSSDALINGIIKTFVCVNGGCKGKMEEVVRVCNLKPDDDAPVTPPAATDAEACAKAVAALHKCVQAKSTVLEGYVSDMEKQQEDPTDESKPEA